MRARLFAPMLLLIAAPLAAQEITVGSLAYLAERTSSFEGSVGTGNATMLGLELTGRFRYVGVTVRAWSGRFDADSSLIGAGKVSTGEIRLVGGPRIINATVGYGRRALDGALAARSWSFLRVGAGSRLELGGSGFAAQIDAGYYTGVSGDGTFDKGNGADVETQLIYHPPRLPVYLSLGYRRERFVASEGSASRPEILSSVLVAAGFSFGRR